MVSTIHNAKFLTKKKKDTNLKKTECDDFLSLTNYIVTLIHFLSENRIEKIEIGPRSCFVRILMIYSRI